MTGWSGLQAFVETARSGSFVAAGERLGLSASAVSKAVRRLEDRLGLKLLHRTTRSLSLTGDGAAFLERAGRLLSELEELTEGKRGAAAMRGPLRITVPHVLGGAVLSEPLATFAAEYPDLQLEVRFDNRVIDLAEEGIDVAVRTGELKDSARLIVTRFFEYQPLFCASPALLARFGTPSTLEELQRLPVLRFLMPSGRPLSWKATRDGKTCPVELPGGHRFDDLDALARAAAAGMGVAMVPTWCCLDLLAEGRLIEVLASHRPPRKTAWLAHHDRRQVSPKVTRFIERMKSLGPYLTARYCPLK